jgi:hypothetical protein
MKTVTKEELLELEKISETISKLKAERILRFGSNWHELLQTKGKGRNKRSEKLVTQSDIVFYINQIDELMALKKWTRTDVSSVLGLDRNCYYYLTKGICSRNTHQVLSKIDWEYLKNN